MAILLLLPLFSALAFSPALAREVADVPNPRTGGSWVTDEMRILTVPERQEIETLITQMEHRTGSEMAVVLLQTIGGRNPKEFAVELFEAWGIGKKGQDNGLLLLLVRDQRRLEVEVGYGLEHVLPDVRVQQILRNEVVTQLKEDKFGAGILNGVRAFTRKVESGYDQAAAPKTSLGKTFVAGILPTLLLYGLPLLLLLALLGRISWILVFQKELAKLSVQLAGAVLIYGIPALVMGAVQVGLMSLSLLYGGATFAAGGLALLALKYWAESYRFRPRSCPKCAKAMDRVADPKEEYRYFSSAQAWEEKLQACDFDVWLCACGATKIDEYDGHESAKFQRCPGCRTRSEVLKKRETVKDASYSEEGLERFDFGCLACQAKRTEERVLPVLRASSGSSGSSGSFGGSSGGSSGGSFGGGRSGGGGSGASF